MPRSAAYFGPIDSGAITNAPQQAQGAYAGAFDSLGQGLSDLVRVFNYDPAKDPKAQQAALYNAQTQADIAKSGREQDTYNRGKAGDTANAQLVQQVGGALQQMPPEERAPALLKFATDYTTNAVKAGADPTKAYVGARNIINMFDTSGKIATAFDTAVTGQPLSNGQYFTDAAHQADVTSGRETTRLDNQEKSDAELAKTGLENTGKTDVANIALTGTKYSADKQAGATLGAAGISAGASVKNNQLSNDTARRGQDLNFQEKTAPKPGYTETKQVDKTAAEKPSSFFGLFAKPGAPEKTNTTVTRTPMPMPAQGAPPPGGAPSPLAAVFAKPPGGPAAGIPRPLKDAFPQIPEGAHVMQGGKGYTKINGQMVPD